MANLNPTTSATIIDFAAARRRRAQKPEPPEPFRPAGALRNVLARQQLEGLVANRRADQSGGNLRYLFCTYNLGCGVV